MPASFVNREVRILLIRRSDEKEEVAYDANPRPFRLPKIGPRPPYYANPRYVRYYPVI